MYKIIRDANTKTEEQVELTPEELAEIKEQEAQAEAERLAREQAEAAKQAKLESAKAKLTALGLEEDEVAVMLGID